MYKIKKGFEGNRVGFRLLDGSAFNKILKDATQDELEELFNANVQGIEAAKNKKNAKEKPAPKLEDFQDEE